MEKNSKGLAVVIPCYNGKEYIENLLLSLKKGSVQPNKIILVDNGSTDGTYVFVKENFPEVELIFFKGKLGYAKASNIGIKKATEQGYKYILLLNQDIICKENTIEKFLYYAEVYKDFFIIFPLILFWPPGENKIMNAGTLMHFLGFGYSGSYKLPLSQLKIGKYSYAPGCSLLFNSKKLKKIGLFDEDIVMYHEDSDLSLRGRFLKEKIIFIPEIQVYHLYKEKIDHFRWYWSERNRLFILFKFYKLPTLILMFPFFVFMEIGIIFFSLLGGWLDLKIRTYFDFLRLFKKMLKKRRMIQQTRQITDKEFLAYLTPVFNFPEVSSPLIKYIVNPIFGLGYKIIYFFTFW